MILDRFSLAGRVGMVTGAGQGLGKVFALSFAEAGADVVVAEIDPESGEQTASEIRAMGRRAVHVPTDVRDRSSCRGAVERAAGDLGRLDFLMNNAGITSWGAAEEVPRRTGGPSWTSTSMGCSSAPRRRRSS